MNWRARCGAASALAFAFLLGISVVAVAQESVLYRFKLGRDGAFPMAGLIMDAHGVLYGTTIEGGHIHISCFSDGNGCGTVFALTPTAMGALQWTETVLHRFRGPAVGGALFPGGSLIMDARGVLYGTTSAGGTGCSGYGCGTVFELTPPAAGGTFWTGRLLYRFEGGRDGMYPAGGLIVDARGVLYGTTGLGGGVSGNCDEGCGTVFALTPPAAGASRWTEEVLHRFTGKPDGRYPTAGLVADANGVLYGSTQSGGAHDRGTVFAMRPPTAVGTGWTETVLYSFGRSAGGGSPDAGLIIDTKGTLYGTTSHRRRRRCCGTVFALSPPAAGATAWVETIIHPFWGLESVNPAVALIADASGVLFGTTFEGGRYGQGTVFALVPPPAGANAWTERVLHSFRGGRDGGQPNAGLIADANGALYGTTSEGGGGNGCGTSGCGTVFKVVP
jgi:uncharacterized repeat protein (TIGR03803 family)